MEARQRRRFEIHCILGILILAAATGFGVHRANSEKELESTVKKIAAAQNQTQWEIVAMRDTSDGAQLELSRIADGMALEMPKQIITLNKQHPDFEKVHGAGPNSVLIFRYSDNPAYQNTRSKPEAAQYWRFTPTDHPKPN